MTALSGCGGGSPLGGLGGRCSNGNSGDLNVTAGEDVGTAVSSFAILQRPETAGDVPPAGSSFVKWAQTPFSPGAGKIRLSSVRRAWSDGYLHVYVAPITGHPEALCVDTTADGKEISANCEEGGETLYTWSLTQTSCGQALVVAVVPSDTAAATVSVGRRSYKGALDHQVFALYVSAHGAHPRALITLRPLHGPAERTVASW